MLARSSQVNDWDGSTPPPPMEEDSFTVRLLGVHKDLLRDLKACDAMVAMFIASAMHEHWQFFLRPFPPEYISRGCGRKRIYFLRGTIEKIPNLSLMLKRMNTFKYDGLPGDVIRLLDWIFNKSLLFRLRSLTKAELKELKQYTSKTPIDPVPTAVFKVCRSKEARHKNRGSELGFYAGRLEQFHFLLKECSDEATDCNPIWPCFDPITLWKTFGLTLEMTKTQVAWPGTEIAALNKCVGLGYTFEREASAPHRVVDPSGDMIETTVSTVLCLEYVIFQDAKVPAEEEERPAGQLSDFRVFQDCWLMSIVLVWAIAIVIYFSSTTEDQKLFFAPTGLIPKQE